jgi:hypothetical protein
MPSGDSSDEEDGDEEEEELLDADLADAEEAEEAEARGEAEEGQGEAAAVGRAFLVTMQDGEALRVRTRRPHEPGERLRVLHTVGGRKAHARDERVCLPRAVRSVPG